MVEFGWHPQRKTRKCLEYRETRIPIEAAEELYLEIGNRQESDEKARVYKTSWWNLLRDTVSADRDLHLYEFAFSPKNCTAQHSLQTLIAPPAHTWEITSSFGMHLVHPLWVEDLTKGWSTKAAWNSSGTLSFFTDTCLFSVQWVQCKTRDFACSKNIDLETIDKSNER